MFDLYAAITDRLIAEMQSGIIPWRKPWTSANAAAISHVTGKPYSMLNQILLRFKVGEYLTFKQVHAEGGYVKKGEKAHMVVFWKWLESEDEDGNKKEVPLLKYYNVFHIDQCEGISPRYDKPVEHSTSPDERAEAVVNGYVARSGVHLECCRSDRAFYRPATDTVVVPELSQYEHAADYYSTLFHELTHSTGHPSRLNRMTEESHFGSESYSKEELIAELGSAFLLHHTGLDTNAVMTNSAAYLQGWLKALQDDKKLIVSAAGKADKAVKYILGEKEEDDTNDAV